MLPKQRNQLLSFEPSVKHSNALEDSGGHVGGQRRGAVGYVHVKALLQTKFLPQLINRQIQRGNVPHEFVASVDMVPALTYAPRWRMVESSLQSSPELHFPLNRLCENRVEFVTES